MFRFIIIFLRYALKIYRRYLGIIYSKYSDGLLPEGLLCSIELSEDNKHCDALHPCIRYTKSKFMGWNWWMVLTPYYNADASKENPLLYYGFSNDHVPPFDWFFYSLINPTPDTGYNSDPNILFTEEGLNVFWRENDSPRTLHDKVSRATYHKLISKYGTHETTVLNLVEEDKHIDREVSPAFLKSNGKYYSYAMHIKFKNKRFQFKSKSIKRISSYILRILSILNIYNQQKTIGISLWESVSLEKTFKYIKTMKITNLNNLYSPWHLDSFEAMNKIYFIIQTNQSNADICLAVKEDSDNVRMYQKPLIVNNSKIFTGIYKATGFVFEGIFYLFYTAQLIEDRKKNHLLRSTYKFSDMIKELEDHE